MTDDLRALLQAASSDSPQTVRDAVARLDLRSFLEARVYWAWLGGIDEAVEVLEHLLPGWDWFSGSNGEAVVIAKGRNGFKETIPGNPARALLLAALRAKMAEGE